MSINPPFMATPVSADQPTPPAVKSPPPQALPSGAKLLVLRFPPPVAQALPEPSGWGAAWRCGLELANAVATTAAVAIAAPETWGASLVGAARIGVAEGNFERCVERDEAKQVKDQSSALALANCESHGGIALSTVRGSLLCVRPE